MIKLNTKKLKKTFEKIYDELDIFFYRLKQPVVDWYYNQKYYRINKKKFKKMLMKHRDWDYCGYFEFMDTFLDGQINLENTWALNRPKLVKKLKVLKELNKRIYEDDYHSQVYDYNPEWSISFDDKFSSAFTQRDVVFKNHKGYYKQRQVDLDAYTDLLNKTILFCWD